MSKKKVFVISHSHWDREWYMGYEKHHMRLIELMDDLLEIFKSQPKFDSFHLDGQTIILDDYLEVRPEKEAEIRKYIEEGRLKIGPFYILQDDFLISSESNVRNALIGYADSKKWGNPVNLGYFPDTFGNMGQTPQMMKLANLDYVAFGRGVKPTGLNNQTFEGESYSSQYSEMWWNGPDKTKILSVLFANWYSNGNEIPIDKVAAKLFWDQKLADAEKYTSTDNILMMNGVDHQPVQKDVIDALEVAQELYPDYEFIHSNFDEYLTILSADIAKTDNIGEISGEITSQETDGWYTLANTSSTRTYLKRRNTQVQRQLENIAEPLSVMAYGGSNKYPHDQFNYAWKLLLQNHPHDSICGCSLDEISHEMMTRFKKSEGVGQYISEQALADFAKQINSSQFADDNKVFTIINTLGSSKTEITEVEIEIDRAPYSEGKPEEQYLKMQKRLKELTGFSVIDSSGEQVEFEVVKKEVRFNYDLPKDRFRIPYVGLYVTIKIPIVEMPAFSWETYGIKEVTTNVSENTAKPIFDVATETMENDWLKVKLNDDGSINILDKKSNRMYENQLVFEDTGDIGNEYIYRQSADNQAIDSRNGNFKYSIIVNDEHEVRIKMETTINIPASADERLQYEQEAVVDITQRTAKRSTEMIQEKIITTLSMNRYEDQIKFETTYNNHAKDHRIRVMFPTGIDTQENHSESIFEVVTRPNTPSKNWKNPTNPQHQQAFVNLSDTQGGMTVGNLGLSEYEILTTDNNTIALTLLRSVGEMGDWGYFPTPEAQCLGEHTFNYSVSFHNDSKQSMNKTFIQARANQVSLQNQQLSIHDGDKSPQGSLLTIADDDVFAVTCLKKAERESAIVLRGFNLNNSEEKLAVEFNKREITPINLIEKDISVPDISLLGPAEIRSYKFK